MKITKSDRATRQRQRLCLGRVRRRLFTLMKSQLCIPTRSIGARRCAEKKATEQPTSWSVRTRAASRETREKERKEGPVIGIGAVEKPWKINYRPCKGVENYIDRRRVNPHEDDWHSPPPFFESAERPYRWRAGTDPLTAISSVADCLNGQILFDTQL